MRSIPPWFQSFSLVCALVIALAWVVTAKGQPPEQRIIEDRSQTEQSTHWLIGFSKLDVTPEEPVRMAGYGSRDRPSDGIDTPLHVRCMAIRQPGDLPSVLVSVDTIGLPGSITRTLANQLQQQHGLTRDRIVFCSTHTHAGPDLVSELSNIFASELSESEIAAGKRYKEKLQFAIVESVGQALGDLQPSQLAHGVGQATFAANRRVLTDGKWTGFGVQADGPVDHTVPVLRVLGMDGSLRGVVFNYACHCTTLGGDHYQINSDWAGYATTSLESKHNGCVALCTIGCGADANPEPRGQLDHAKLHGRVLAEEVERILSTEMNSINMSLETKFDYAALSFELPTQEELESRLDDSSPQTRRHAEQLLETLRVHHRLPATYPVPIQAWSFGDQLTMIFLGGEVVVDYALRLRSSLKDPNLWVTAYANDVLGYIASETMRGEGGYEFDRSGIYYGLPGPWASGTEDLLIARIERMIESRGRSRGLVPPEALQSMQITDGFQIELAASEPIVRDPINLAFDADGRMWVVEMGDYPEGENKGRIKILRDQDQDGVFETSKLFLDNLSYPTGVFPWRDGVLISVAPDILYARDTTGDGRADEVEKLYTGFRLANPQHRINGFTYGLDHSLHLASGDNLGELTSLKSGESVDGSGHDVRIEPDKGTLSVTSGRTQFVRSRNDWGEWFGNDNSRPMYHFPVDARYLQRNRAIGYSAGSEQLFHPPVAPPVFPATEATERFNDLFAANRFTSACSSIIARNPIFSTASNNEVAFICEPVHNLVHRAVLEPQGASYTAKRPNSELQSEFLASSDPWFRPVRALVGPEGALYVVDMYRETIEHPEWIPESWQAQLDLTAGSDRGRIYRITPTDGHSAKLPVIADWSDRQLFDALGSPIGALRDLVQQQILERPSETLREPLIEAACSSSEALRQVHSLSILSARAQLDPETLKSALRSDHPGVLLVAIQLSESRLDDPDFIQLLSRTAEHPDPRVVKQTALALGQSDSPLAGAILAEIALTPHLDRWIAQAVLSSSRPHINLVLRAVLEHDTSQDGFSSISQRNELRTKLLATARSNGTDLAAEFADFFSAEDVDYDSRIALAASFASAIGDSASVSDLLRPLYGSAIETITDESASESHRCEALQLVAIGIESAETERKLLADLLAPSVPMEVQIAAVSRLGKLRDAKSCAAMIERWPSLSKDVRDRCVGEMLQRYAWTEQLLDAMESKRIQTRELSPATLQQLRHTGSRSMRVRAQRLAMQVSDGAKQSLVRRYLTEMSGETDLANGGKLFKQHCSVCHVANEGGHAVGASLDNLTDRSHVALVNAILDPNKAVDPKYLTYVVRTEDDRILTGAIEQEAGDSVTLAHADGKRTTLPRSEIAEMKNAGVSLMPEGLESVLTPESMRDLISYLQNSTSSKRTP